MLQITSRPEALAVREQNTGGSPEIVIFGVDQATGLIVEIVVDPVSAVELGKTLTASKIDVAPASALEQLRRNGHGH